jgi:hypothetical protein
LGGDTWNFHFSLLLCIVYKCACIYFWLISFYLWLALVFLFSRVYYGFTPLRHHTSRHYTSWQMTIMELSCSWQKLIENQQYIIINLRVDYL